MTIFIIIYLLGFVLGYRLGYRAYAQSILKKKSHASYRDISDALSAGAIAGMLWPISILVIVFRWYIIDCQLLKKTMKKIFVPTVEGFNDR